MEDGTCRIVSLKPVRNHHQHKISIGQVVVLKTWHDHEDDFILGEVLRDDDEVIVTGFQGKIKLIVVGHHRDCDGTPLYILSVKPIGYLTDDWGNLPGGHNEIDQSFRYRRWVNFFLTSIGESNICPTGETVPLTFHSIYEYEAKLQRDLEELSASR